LRVVVTDVEFALNTARALLPAYPEKAAVFVNRVLADTADPRLRFLVSPTLSMIEHDDMEAAIRWLDRAVNYEQARRARRGS
jgi:hypothetical protein